MSKTEVIDGGTIYIVQAKEYQALQKVAEAGSELASLVHEYCWEFETSMTPMLKARDKYLSALAELNGIAK
jgi:hypothetical protein